MSGRCTVFVGDGAWRVVCVNGEGAHRLELNSDDGAALEDRASAVARAVAELGGSGPIVLALPSSWCLSAAIVTDGLGRSGRRQAMAYLLEEQLPLSAEDAVADYVEQPGGAMGVCAEVDRLSPVIAALESAGLSVVHVCPAALLAGARWVERRGDADAVVVRLGGAADRVGADAGLDLIEIDRRRPSRWWWLTEASSLDERLGAMRGAAGDTAVKLVTGGALPGALMADGLDVMCVDEDGDDAAAWQGARVLAGEAGPWIELRRDRLAAAGRGRVYRAQGLALAGALALLLLCVIGVTYWRGSAYERQAADYDAQVVAVYKQALPTAGPPPPGAALVRMKSELATLRGIGGQAAATNNPNAEPLYPDSALTHLHDVLTALPRGLRFQVADLSIRSGVIRVTGKASDIETPERLTAALRATGRYEVTPPNVTALGPYEVDFDFSATPIKAGPTSAPRAANNTERARP